MNRRHLIAVPLAALPSLAAAHSYKHGSIATGHAWALPSQLSEAQVFFPMVNNGGRRDELIAARSAICSTIELRQNNRYDDPPLTSMALEPGRPVPMRPTARHLRLIGLRQPLVLGDRFTMILDFLNAGETEIDVLVETKPGD